MTRAILNVLAQDHGIHFPNARELLPRNRQEMLQKLANDAQTQTVTTGNSGIPAFLLNVVDPTTIDVLVAPVTSEEILGSSQKGSWTDVFAQFPIAESVGRTAAYGDYNNNGMSNANINWTNRQQFLYQTITKFGDLELARAGAGGIDYANMTNKSAAAIMRKFENTVNYFGIAGQASYGYLNDPSIPAAVAPDPTGTGGGTTFSTMDGIAIYNQFLKLETKLITQTRGNYKPGDPVVAVVPPQIMPYLMVTNSFGVQTAMSLIKANFANITFVAAPELATPSGNVIMLIAKSLNGQDTGYTAFSEKMRTHGMVRELSAVAEKRSGGTWGAIIRQPLAFAQMIGV